MRAMVLCAGYGTRLRPLTDRSPKPLISIGGAVLLDDTLEHLAAHGVDSAIINGSWLAGDLERHLQRSNLPMTTVFQREDTPLGTAGAVRRALPELGDEFMVVYGDNLTRQPVEPLIELHRSLGAELTMSLAPTGDPSSKGIVRTDPEGRVFAFTEKPPPDMAVSNLANSGIFVCSSSVVSHLENGAFSDFGNDVLPMLLDSGRNVAAELPGGYTRDIGTLRSYLVACHDVLSGTVTPYRMPEGLRDLRLLEEGSLVGDASFTGTAWVRAGAEIGDGCILENCVVLERASVGRGSHLRNTLVLPGVRVPEGTDASEKYLSVF